VRHEDKQTPTAIAEATSRTRNDAVTSIWGVIALSLLLRVLFLGKSFWLDEGVAFADAWAGGLPITRWSEWIRGLWQGEFNMVFYFALLRVWIQGGTSEIYLRLISVAPAVATVPIVYALGKRLCNERAGKIAAILLAVHGAHVGYSQELRGYTMVVFFAAASTLALLLAIEERRNRYWFLYWVCSVLAVYTHFFGGLVVVSQWFSLWWTPPRIVRWKKLLATAAAILLCVAPAVVFVLTNKGQQVDWIPKPSLGQMVNVFSEFAGSPTALPVYAVLWCFGILYFARLKQARQRTRQTWPMALVICWAVVPVILALILSLKRPMLVPRYLLVSVPACVLLASIGSTQIATRRRHLLIGAAVVLSLAFIVVRYTRPKENWRDATAYVMSHSQPTDAVAVVPWWSEGPFSYYKLRSDPKRVTDVPASAIAERRSIADVAARHRRLWVITYARPQGLSDPQVQASKAVLTEYYSLVEQRNFRLVRVLLYAPKPAISEAK